jgi:hypothetical protein
MEQGRAPGQSTSTFALMISSSRNLEPPGAIGSPAADFLLAYLTVDDASELNHSPFIRPLYLRIGTATLEAPCRAPPESNRDERASVGRKQPKKASNGFPNKRKVYSVHSYRATLMILRMRPDKLPPAH